MPSSFGLHVSAGILSQPASRWMSLLDDQIPFLAENPGRNFSSGFDTVTRQFAREKLGAYHNTGIESEIYQMLIIDISL